MEFLLHEALMEEFAKRKIIEIIKEAVDAYYGNSLENAIKLVIKHWIATKRIIVANQNKKSSQLASQKIAKGNEIVAEMPTLSEEIIKIYTKAMALAPNKSPELAKAYGNRSAVLCNLRRYEDSLNDINRALELGYPNNLKAKLYARRAKNLLAINPNNRNEAEQAINEAKIWMVKMDKKNKDQVEASLKDLDKPKKFAKPVEKKDSSKVLPEIEEPNDQLFGASNAIALKYSEQFGRHIVATRDIKPGEIIIKQKSYAVVLNEKNFYTHCWNCSKRIWSSVPCKQCINVIFCDEKCRDEAWQSFHDLECEFITAIGSHLNFAELMSMRLTMKALKEAGSTAKLKKQLENIDSISDLLVKGFVDGKFDGTKYASVYTLSKTINHKLDVNIQILKLLKLTTMIFLWMKTTNVIGKKIDNLNELLNNESAIFLAALTLKNIDIVGTNCFEAGYHVGTSWHERGCMLSALTSYINHSCDSNACMVHSGDTIGVNCVQTIKKGEQVFLSYGQYYQKTSAHERRMILQDRYNFWCECHACRDNWGPHSLWPSFMNQPLTRQVKNKIRNSIEKFQKQFEGKSESEIEDKMSTDPDLIQPLAEQLTILNENASYPCEEARMYKILLKYNYMYNSD